MTTENPFKEGLEIDRPDEDEPQHSLTSEETYHLVSDTVTGLNVRMSDNKFQALFILGTVLLLATIGMGLAALFPDWNLPWYAGALLGALAGLVLGLFTSGFLLMIYRGARHLKGDHR